LGANHPANTPSIAKLLTQPRLATYDIASSGDRDRALRLYSWNIQASAALWMDFSVLEVILRNALDAQLAAYCHQPDWWNAPQVRLHVEQQQALKRALSAIGRSGTAPPSGQAVANLTFGFWTSLLSNRYHQMLWVPSLINAFPYFQGRRGNLHKSLDELRRLRNRIAHHEALINRDLAADHQSVLLAQLFKALGKAPG